VVARLGLRGRARPFPLTRPIVWRDRRVGYCRAGLLGGVNAVTGETRLWIAPGTDSLTAAWARLFAPLVQPLDSMPPGLRAQLSYPPGAFRLAAAALERLESDSLGWAPRPADPFALIAPEAGRGLRLTRGRARVSSPPRDRTAARRAAHRHRDARPAAGSSCGVPPPRRSPGRRRSSAAAETKPGVLRLWPAGGELLAVQAQFAQAIDTDACPGCCVFTFAGEPPRRGGNGARRAPQHAVGPCAARRHDVDWPLARGPAPRGAGGFGAGGRNLERFAELFELSELLKLAHTPDAARLRARETPDRSSSRSAAMPSPRRGSAPRSPISSATRGRVSRRSWSWRAPGGTSPGARQRPTGGRRPGAPTSSPPIRWSHAARRAGGRDGGVDGYMIQQSLQKRTGPRPGRSAASSRSSRRRCATPATRAADADQADRHPLDRRRCRLQARGVRRPGRAAGSNRWRRLTPSPVRSGSSSGHDPPPLCPRGTS